VAFIVLLALGLFIIRFARSCYRNPHIMLQRWYSYLPQSEWAKATLRGFSVVSIWGGFMMIAQGVVGLPFLQAHRGTPFGFLMVGIATFATILILRSARREPGNARNARMRAKR
jgi:hypothetical protein